MKKTCILNEYPRFAKKIGAKIIFCILQNNCLFAAINVTTCLNNLDFFNCRNDVITKTFTGDSVSLSFRLVRALIRDLII